jgi:hypothetical protein
MRHRQALKPLMQQVQRPKGHLQLQRLLHQRQLREHDE